MKLPKKIKIGGHTIKIKQVKSDTLKNHGSYDNWYKEIQINIDSTTESTQAEALLHEIIEAIKGVNNLDLDHKDLTVISENIFAVIRNNKIDFR